ncbi:MAG TPA: hypothetical protein H9913_05325 [Candidatus Blautia stercoripullorum]|uniref:Uncharacterized protein n=1 Tax=Candidatus Blautia stercoripullorum TaxID=2838502 RepID=A0A9D2R9U4_9FIRM|nr:hypothetical protein [Candidatus Blautia stercoripullorum]
MKKKNFVSMIMGTVGGILFAIGMCMCLLPQWNAFNQGIVMGAIGAVILFAMLIVRRKMEGKPAVKLNGKAVGTILFGIVGALALGVGMCMVMVWNMLVQGILVGFVGIVLLLCLIPIVKGLK